MFDASVKRHLLNGGGISPNPQVSRSEQLVSSAPRELQEAWVRRHHELYSESLRESQRQLERRSVIDACARAILFPVSLLVSVCAAVSHWTWALTRRIQMRHELQKRINTMDRIRPWQLPQAPWHQASQLPTGARGLTGELSRSSD
jgi:hypothetical protein